MEKPVENRDEKLIKAIDKGMGSQIHVRIPVELYPELMAVLKEAEPLIAERSPKEKDTPE
jgi:hypothetical protein